MPQLFVLIGLIMAGIAAVLRFLPHARLLDFVDYGAAHGSLPYSLR